MARKIRHRPEHELWPPKIIKNTYKPRNGCTNPGSLVSRLAHKTVSITKITFLTCKNVERAVPHLVQALRHKTGGFGFDSRYGPWIFSGDVLHFIPGGYSCQLCRSPK